MKRNPQATAHIIPLIVVSEGCPAAILERKTSLETDSHQVLNARLPSIFFPDICRLYTTQISV